MAAAKKGATLGSILGPKGALLGAVIGGGAASNVGNTKLKQSKHLVIAVIAGIFSFFVYHIPGIIEFIMVK